ncbi:folylpolyglutamate synthase/dihydrofolate synthase family protein [Helicobacter salomonis]|uniref:bifunctional folylpolyglutamate synthase/dihydrofolate synthase n=1 Tax=Helicobacter salomonis TaxID=56878 RepID=UPI000CF11FC3|nr:bifunctional folylpolyglutamate synthase/dihydrofolate synthase [Helicobacter salomonis]
MNLSAFLTSLAQEYAPFDPTRFPKVYARFLERFSDNTPKIQIIGTNGKGSTGRFITLLLEQAGLKVLHFTSPHLLSFRERFYTQGSIIPENALQEAHAHLHKYLHKLRLDSHISYFEYATLLAVVLAQDCDLMVAEAGLGGALDSTTHLHARCALVCTPISLDHTDRLGSTLSEIAHTKLAAMGSLEPNTPIILAPQDPSVQMQAQEMATSHSLPLFLVNPPSPTACIYANHYAYPLFLAQNLQTALDSLEVLQLPHNPATIPPLDLRGRFEILESNLILDVVHNVGGAKVLKEALQQNFKDQKIHLVYNSYARKDVRSILECLRSVIARVWVFKVEDIQIMELEKLEDLLEKLHLAWEIFSWKKFYALKEENLWVVGGSFSVVGTFLREYDAG